MDIVLATINAKWIHPSLALRLLKANLGNLEENCGILEFALRQPLSEKVNPILDARPVLLGISVSIWNHAATIELLKALLKALDEKWGAGPELPKRPIVVLGGPEVSWLNEDAEIFRYSDFVIRGEAENSFRNLCYEVLSEKRQDNVKRKAPVFINPVYKNRVFINRGDTTVNVQTLASAYRLYTDEDLQKKLVYVEASRGCPFGCEFCLSSAIHLNGIMPVREFPLEPFLTEMGELIDRGARIFKFLDRTFNLNMDRVKRIMEFFLGRIEAAPKHEKPLCVHFEMVPARFPSELKKLLCRFPRGTLRIETGIQTFNPETAKLINRAGDMAEEIETLKFLCRESNAIIHADLIAGLPGENLASFGTGFNLLWGTLSGNNLFEIQLGILKCLPGTPIARHNKAYGMRFSPDPPYEIIETGAIPEPDLARIKNFARFWELIVNRNPFPEILSCLLAPGEPVFDKFMLLSDRLLKHFGRNWGIDREELRSHLKEILEEIINKIKP